MAGNVERGTMTTEAKRLAAARGRTAHWKRWGPYLTERQWGTVREDYSPHGTAWDYFPHDHAPSRVYEYFHGDNGAGIGAGHQTGWTGLVAKLLQQSGE